VASIPTLASSEGERPRAGGGSAGGRTTVRIGLAGITVLALIAFAVYAAVLASRTDELAVSEAVPISVPGAGTATGPFGTGVAAPDFALQTVDGQTVRLSDFAGRPVWINVWASWCAPCRAEMPDIEQVYRETQGASAGGVGGGAGPVILLISLGEDPPVVQRYLSTTGYQLPVLLDPEYALTRDYRITGLPTHFFIDREGKLRDVAIGGLKPNGMRARLARIAGS
jgi:cytochrome c biogenesis protein CcmG, thiol:disulfide interchange protein DsbE